MIVNNIIALTFAFLMLLVWLFWWNTVCLELAHSPKWGILVEPLLSVEFKWPKWKGQILCGVSEIIFEGLEEHETNSGSFF